MEEKKLLREIATYLYLSKKSLVSTIFIITGLPVIIYLISVALLQYKYRYLGILTAILGLIWILIQVRALSKAIKMGREITVEDSVFSALIREINTYSGYGKTLLLTIILSPFYFIISILLFSRYKQLKKLYDEVKGETGSGDIEHDLDETLKKSHKKLRGED